MVKPNSMFDAMAEDVASRIEAARDAGAQMALPLPDEAGAQAVRAARGKGKAQMMLRDWLAARGLALPEDRLADIAGLNSREDVFVWAMQRTEQVLVWAEAGARPSKGNPADASLGQRLATFQFVFTAALRSAEALLPYGLGKVSPDVAPQAPVTIVMPGAQMPSQGPETARDVTPRPARMAPPPMPTRVEQNQGVSGTDAPHSDAAIRTQGPST